MVYVNTNVYNLLLVDVHLIVKIDFEAVSSCLRQCCERDLYQLVFARPITDYQGRVPQLLQTHGAKLLVTVLLNYSKPRVRNK